jgi:hypothetical protein
MYPLGNTSHSLVDFSLYKSVVLELVMQYILYQIDTCWHK